MESKHLVGGIGKTTTGEQVTVIAYPYRLPNRLKPLTECILETQKNFGKAAIGTVLLLCIDPKAKSCFAATVCAWLSFRRIIRCSAKRWKPCRACVGSYI